MADTFVSITGNLTDDPELRFTQAGVPVLGRPYQAARDPAFRFLVVSFRPAAYRSLRWAEPDASTIGISVPARVPGSVDVPGDLAPGRRWRRSVGGSPSARSGSRSVMRLAWR